jgi:hypothetical protein
MLLLKIVRQIAKKPGYDIIRDPGLPGSVSRGSQIGKVPNTCWHTIDAANFIRINHQT